MKNSEVPSYFFSNENKIYVISITRGKNHEAKLHAEKISHCQNTTWQKFCAKKFGIIKMKCSENSGCANSDDKHSHTKITRHKINYF